MNDDARPTLTLERFASLYAYVAHFGRAAEAEVLERRGVPGAVWQQSRRHWLARLRQADPKALEAHTFGTRLAETAERLERERPSLHEVGPLAREAALSSDEPMTVVTRSVEPATQLRVELPSLPSSSALALARRSPADDSGEAGRSGAGPAAPEEDPLNLTMPSEPSPTTTPHPDRASSSEPDATAFIVTPFVDVEAAEDPMSVTIPAAPAGLDGSARGSGPAPPAPDGRGPEAPMSPERYARLACATHGAPSVMREQIHASLGIADEAQRARLDRAMTAHLTVHGADRQLYLQWVAYLRQGGR